MKFYHVTTEKKARLYHKTGYIKAPVRGFDTLQASMAWAIKTGKKVIYACNADKLHKMPDHHNQFGEAWWNDGDISMNDCKCVFSAEKDA